MASKRTEKARERLLKKYRFGAAGSDPPGCPEIESIEVTGPASVVVGDLVPLHVEVKPPGVNCLAAVTRAGGTAYGILYRRLTWWNTPTDDPGSGDFAFVKGVLLPSYGVEIVNSEGNFTVTQYTLEPFSVQVSCGGKSHTWPIARTDVWCRVKATRETPGQSMSCYPNDRRRDDQPWVALP